jgi:hypothetical protein
MKDELKYSIEKFNKALSKLTLGIKKAKDQLDNDGVTKFKMVNGIRNFLI